MKRPSLALRLEPGREIVEQNAQCSGELGECDEAAWLPSGFYLADEVSR